MSDGNKQSIAISFEVLCSDEYSETVDIKIPLQRASEDGDQTDAAGQVLVDKQWVFLVDEAGLKYLLQRVESKQAFEIQFQHISAEQDKKKGSINTVLHNASLQLPLRPFIRPGTCQLPQTEYTLHWTANIGDAKVENEESVQSQVALQFSFADALIAPFVKETPTAADLVEKSQIRRAHDELQQHAIKITSKAKFQAIMASIQEELAQKYLKVCTTYNDMSRSQRKQAFMSYLLSSTYGQRLTAILSKAIVAVAQQEMHAEPNLTKPELAIKLRAKLESACDPVFEHILTNRFEERTHSNVSTKPTAQHSMSPYLACTNADNIYAAPFRDINKMKVLIEIALLNQDYSAAEKWITQAMTICQDEELFAVLHLKLAFVTSQLNASKSTISHSIRSALSIKESKPILFSQIMLLCEQNKLEEAEPFMDKLLTLFPNDASVQILKGLFEHLMEEIEDAQSIWQQQFDLIQANIQKQVEAQTANKSEKNTVDDDMDEEDEDEDEKTEEFEVHENISSVDENTRNTCSFYSVWEYALRIALKLNCSEMATLMLSVCKPYFEHSKQSQIEYIILQHHVLMHEQQYEDALLKLGEAVLMNDHDVRLWMHIGSTYCCLNKLTECIEAYQRHINECHAQQQQSPNMMAMLKLIEMYFVAHRQTDSEAELDESLLENAAVLIEMCERRIANGDISEHDGLDILASFDEMDEECLLQVIRYKLWCLRGEFYAEKNERAAALSYFAKASSVHPFDEELWAKIEGASDIH